MVEVMLAPIAIHTAACLAAPSPPLTNRRHGNTSSITIIIAWRGPPPPLRPLPPWQVSRQTVPRNTVREDIWACVTGSSSSHSPFHIVDWRIRGHTLGHARPHVRLTTSHLTTSLCVPQLTVCTKLLKTYKKNTILFFLPQ